MLCPDARRELNAWLDAHPGCTPDEQYQAEEDILGDEDMWRTAALGRFASPLLCSARVGRAEELVLATDGARLSAERVANLPTWLAELRDWERREFVARAAVKRHDDVAVLHLRAG